MRFYIFGTNGNHIIATARKALFESDCLEEVVDKFERYIQEVKFKTLFLVLDTEYGKRSFIKPATVEGGDEYIPFFIIGQWRLGQDKDKWIRGDRTQIVKKGFIREFTNNLIATREFLIDINKSEPSELRIIYKKLFKNKGKEYSRIFDKKIASTMEILNQKKDYKTHIFWIQFPNWRPVPLRERIFNMYEIIDTDKDGEKPITTLEFKPL